jgi:hypothetical protein
MTGSSKRAAERAPETIVFIARYPLTPRLRRAWGFERLAEAGFRVIVLDLRPVLAPWMLESDDAEAVSPAEVVKVHSFRELDVVIGGLAPDSVFIETLVATADADWDGLRVLRALGRHDAVIYALAAGDIPHPSQMQSAEGRKRLRRDRLKRAADPKQLVGYLRRKSIAYGIRKFGLAPLPARIFGTRSETVMRYFTRMGMSGDRLTPTNAPDYERYRELVEVDPNPAQDDTCVFLDMNLTAHPDIKILGLPGVDGVRYIDSMNHLFDAIEQDTGYEVVIAAHPSTAHDDSVYRGRRIVHGKTAELVSRSRCVISHASTAVGYAVLWRKPALFVTTDEMVRAGYALDVAAIATALGSALRNVDHWTPNSREEDYLKVSESDYESYEREFLFSPESRTRSSWDVMSECAHLDITSRRAGTGRTASKR